ncbi:MAG: leucine--tRNA ligase [Saprospiraceae bacterium]|nr:leucine--tRNA ligase [Candidatus Brachybacter algidus]
MEWNSKNVENKWKYEWNESGLYKVETDPSKPKFYVLDMFPYPSGAGLHVGHPLGYIASDIYTRYKRLNGFNVLHPMGYDSFGLPAEQYAIQTGVHPASSTAENISQFRKQLDNLGFSYDWSRELMTSDPNYYKWTQWIFLKMFNAYYDLCENKAVDIDKLIKRFEENGSEGVNAVATSKMEFTAEQWNSSTPKEQDDILMNYRLMYRKYSTVNWCEELGTVLANDEIKDGLSERGGYPVIKKPMMQWSMRTTAYAQRLLNGLDKVDWPESLKIMQRNWIGRSEGAKMSFSLKGRDEKIEIFTTRPDTIFGVSFMVLAPEHPMVDQLTIETQKVLMKEYVKSSTKASEADRLNADKSMTGVFTGSYAIHPFSGKEIPVYVSNYVLIDYGSGAIMAVPAGDERDLRFAETFDLPVPQIIERAENADIESKDGTLKNSDFLDGLSIPDAIKAALERIEVQGIGTKLINFRLRDANYSRQRYWGEPFPIAYDADGVVQPLNDLPLELPQIRDFKPAGDGSSPIAKAIEWVNAEEGLKRETDTMPGFAGSSWYFLRYMDPHNADAPFSAEAINYWKDVDLYIGGAEHAVGHLLYSRTWHKFMFDMGLTVTEEPFKKLVNQGMIQGVSEKTYLVKDLQSVVYFKNEAGQWESSPLNKPTRIFISSELAADYPSETSTGNPDLNGISEMTVHIDYIKDYGESTGGYLDTDGIQKFTQWRSEYAEAAFVTANGYFQHNILNSIIPGEPSRFNTKAEVEKMSKSKYNVINPDKVINAHGADVFRMYEMFLGPLEQAKPWDIKGIEGVAKFLKRFWSQFFDERGQLNLTEEAPSEEALKVLHKTIKKISEDIEKLALNTCISAFMIALNDIRKLDVKNRSILEPMVILLAPFAPFMMEELWQQLGHKESVHKATWPQLDEKHIFSSVITYPLCINGKKRDLMDFPLEATDAEITETTLSRPEIIKWLEGKAPKKVIVVKGKMVNVVV